MALLENKLIRLRALEADDLEDLYRWENMTDLWIHGNATSPYSKIALRQYINESQLYDIYQNKQLRLMVETSKEHITIGTVDMYDFDMRNKRAGVGILIDEKYRNRQYAQQSLQLLEEYAFSFLSLHQLYAYISVRNAISLKLFENAGYAKAGEIKDWIMTENGNYENIMILQLINKI